MANNPRSQPPGGKPQLDPQRQGQIDTQRQQEESDRRNRVLTDDEENEQV